MSKKRSPFQLDTTFRYETTYITRYKRFGGKKVEKTLVVFIGYLDRDIEVIPREHQSYQWVAWNPPHRIQPQTIDPLLSEVELRSVALDFDLKKQAVE